MTDSGEISIGGGVGIGRARVDLANMRGEAGPYSPRLVIPVVIEMFARPQSHQTAILRLTASLHTNKEAQPEHQIGEIVSVDLVNSMPCRSTQHPPAPHIIDFRFHLTPALIYRLEQLRHTQLTKGRFEFYLRLLPTTAWLRATGNAPPIRVGQGWPSDAGMFSELSLFWQSKIEPLRVEVENSLWVERVLPGWGLENVRLVEVHLPTGDGTEKTARPNTVALFDKARREFDVRRYSDSVAACRGVQNSLEIMLGATKGRPVAETIREAQRWNSDDARAACLDKVWQGLDILVNAANHPERGPQPIDSPDARFCLHLTAILAEYVQNLRRHA